MAYYFLHPALRYWSVHRKEVILRDVRKTIHALLLNRTLESTRSCKLISDVDLWPNLQERLGQVGVWGHGARCCRQTEETRSSIEEEGRLLILSDATSWSIGHQTRHFLIGCLIIWKTSPFTNKNMKVGRCRREFSGGRSCPSLLLLLGSGFMLLLLLSAAERISMRLIEGKAVCVCVWVPRPVYQEIYAFTVNACFSLWQDW